MDLKAWINTVLSAAACGAIATLSQVSLDPNNINWKHTGSVALTGALIGIVQHFRAAPGTVSMPKC